jgi:hypothetical protein
MPRSAPICPLVFGGHRVLDGLKLLPGLSNCHMHLCLGGEAERAAVLRACAQDARAGAICMTSGHGWRLRAF